MDLETKLFDLVYTQLAYPGTVAKTDLRQICQGHARAVIGFFVSSLATPEKKRLVELNLAARRRRTVQSRPQTDHSDRLEKLSTLERRLAAVKREYRTKAFQRDITAAFHKSITQEIDSLTQLAVHAKSQESALLAVSECGEDLQSRVAEAAERLDYLCQDSGKPPTGEAALMVLTSASLTQCLPDALKALISMSESEQRAVTEKSNGLSLEAEARKQGFVYLKQGKTGTLQREDGLELISKLRKQVEALRGHEWQQFVEVEEVLARAKDLRRSFKKLQQAKVALPGSSHALAEYLKLELELQGKQAQVKSLEKGFEALEHTLESLQNRLELLRTQPARGLKTASERDALISRHISLAEGNSAYRRSLPKLKLRIKDFVTKHFFPMCESLPVLSAAVRDCVTQETQAVSTFWPSIYRGSTGTFGIDLPSTEARRDKIEDWKLQKLLQAVGLPCYTSVERLREWLQVEAVGEVADVRAVEARIAEVHKKEVLTEAPLGLQRLKEAENLLLDEHKHVTELMDKDVPQWQQQPAQFLIPWVTDSEGLSIKDYIDQWRSHVLRSY